MKNVLVILACVLCVSSINCLNITTYKNVSAIVFQQGNFTAAGPGLPSRPQLRCLDDAKKTLCNYAPRQMKCQNLGFQRSFSPNWKCGSTGLNKTLSIRMTNVTCAPVPGTNNGSIYLDTCGLVYSMTNDAFSSHLSKALMLMSLVASFFLGSKYQNLY